MSRQPPGRLAIQDRAARLRPVDVGRSSAEFLGSGSAYQATLRTVKQITKLCQTKRTRRWPPPHFRHGPHRSVAVRPAYSWPGLARPRTLPPLETYAGMSRFLRSHIRTHLIWLPLGGLVLALACSRPLDRPLDGARPIGAGQAPSRLVEPPPTVVPPESSLTVPPSPIVIVLGSPSPSPATTVAGRNPILSGLLPAPDALVASGSVNIGARIAASSELSEVVLLLDGAPVQPNVTPQDPKTWHVAYTGKLDVGKHEVRLNAKDSDGRAGGYRWQFDVQDKPPRLAATPLQLPTTQLLPAQPPETATPVPRPPTAPTPRPRR